MAFARHNIEKQRLIEMVRQNPLLWDCRLPHFKRSDKKKDVKWGELGRAFGVSGERVQRTFTSLREIFRRELNHEKMLGDRFESRWEYYEAMSFLKAVIRERKTRERAKKDLNDTNKEMTDECTYYPPQLTRNCLNMQPIYVSSPPSIQPEHSSSHSTTSSVSIKEELSDHDDGDEEDNQKLPRIRYNSRKASRIIPIQSNRTVSPEPTPTTSNNQRPSAKNINELEDDCFTAIRQTPREIMYGKFGEFLSARLNTLNETVANDLMNRILLLIAEN